MNILEQYGLSTSQELYIQKQGLTDFTIGRITQQHRDSYQVITEEGNFRAIITGNLRYSAADRLDLPIVGDWVTLVPSDETYIILKVLPRESILQRQEVATKSESQPIAANLDFALIVQSMDQNFNINRLERYVTICHTGQITPIVVLNKCDLLSAETLLVKKELVQKRLYKINIICTNALETAGLAALFEMLLPGKTYGIIGSSGVGKSSIVNTILGENLLKTGEIGAGHGKGKHTTTHRELLLLPSGSMLIDTPGMRELGLTESEEGLSQSFEKIDKLAQDCQFADCNHIEEPNCAVLKAVQKGDLDPSELDNFQKLRRESERFTMSKMEKRKKDKDLGKMYKSIIKEKQKRKF